MPRDFEKIFLGFFLVSDIYDIIISDTLVPEFVDIEVESFIEISTPLFRTGF
jgi:hypothetical protein